MGSHIADTLSEKNYKIILFDKIPSAFRNKNQKMVVGDILDRKKLFRALRGIEVVFHLAALADLDKAWKNPRETMKTNVLGTTNVLEAARLNGVKRFIFASTLYCGSRAGSLYRVSKQAGEELIKTYHEYCGMEYIILRFGTIYGTRATDSNSIGGLLKQALTGTIKYYGTGEEVREYIHVRDAAKICTELLGDKYVGDTLILTGYHRFKLKEILEMINEILGSKVKIEYYPQENKAHYKQVPYAYISKQPKRIIPDTCADLGASLVEIMEEINEKNTMHRG